MDYDTLQVKKEIEIEREVYYKLVAKNYRNGLITIYNELATAILAKTKAPVYLYSIESTGVVIVLLKFMVNHFEEEISREEYERFVEDIQQIKRKLKNPVEIKGRQLQKRIDLGLSWYQIIQRMKNN